MTETTETTETRDVRDLSDAELRDVQRRAVASVREVSAKRRAGKATSRDYTEGTEAARDAVSARDELGRRAANRSEQSLMHKIGLRRHPLTLARDLDPDVLDGVPLNPDLLSDAELDELRRLLRPRRERAITEEDLARFELLVGQAAGEPGLYARRRDEIERSQAMKAEATNLARAFLPRRRRDPEPGSIELPALLWSWVTNGEDDTFDLTDLGMLARPRLLVCQREWRAVGAWELRPRRAGAEHRDREVGHRSPAPDPRG